MLLWFCTSTPVMNVSSFKEHFFSNDRHWHLTNETTAYVKALFSHLFVISLLFYVSYLYQKVLVMVHVQPFLIKRLP